MHGNRKTVFETVGKVLALHDPCKSVLRSELDHAAAPQLVTPFRVIADFGFFRVQYQAGLCKIGHGIFLDLFACQWGTGNVSSAGITDHRREITDQEYHDMSEILQLAHFIQYNRMTQMQIRCSRIPAPA